MKKRIIDAYRFPGFIPTQKTQQVPWDEKAIAIVLIRRQKKRFVLNADRRTKVSMTDALNSFMTFRAETCVSMCPSKSGVLSVPGVAW